MQSQSSAGDWLSFIPEEYRSRVADRRVLKPGDIGRKLALFVVDVSYGFTGDRSEPILESMKRWPQSSGEDAWIGIPVIRRLIDGARVATVPVLFSTGAYRPDGWDYGSWHWKVSTVKRENRLQMNRDPMQIVDELAPLPDEAIIYKRKPSIFQGTPLLQKLIRAGIDTLLVCGTTTSGCVRASVCDAASLGFKVVIVEDGCFDRTQAPHAVALFDMARLFGTVISADAALDVLAEGAA